MQKNFKRFSISVLSPLFFVATSLPFDFAQCTESVKAASPIVPRKLLVEDRESPRGVDVKTPGLSWTLSCLKPELFGQRQTAYRILVASSEKRLEENNGDLWDSEKVVSSETRGIRYAGKDLSSSQDVFWKVRVWDQDDLASGWSDATRWSMGVLSDEDWRQARWISQKNMVDSRTRVRKSLGFHGSESPTPDRTEWVQVDLGSSQTPQHVVLYPMFHDARKGFGFPVRFKIEISEDSRFETPILIANHTNEDYPNPGTEPVVFDANRHRGRYVRVTATKLWPRDDKVYCFALRQLAVLSTQGDHLARNAPVQASASTNDFGWHKDGLTDGVLHSEESSPKDSASLLLRRGFHVKSGLKRAVAHVSGLGHYELTLNGEKLGDALLAPGWTDYRKTVLYDTYDMTPQLKSGRNVVGLHLANGMYHVLKTEGRYNKFVGTFGPLKAVGLIRLEYHDGTVEHVVTDERWQVRGGPELYCDVFGGEDYDARVVPENWDRPEDDGGEFRETGNTWESAAVTDGPGGVLRGATFANPPIRAFEVFRPASIRQIKPDTIVYDMGQNASVIPRLRIKGQAGARVRMYPAELLHENECVNQHSSGGPSYWQYTLRGDGGGEEYFSKFFYRGARYLQLELSPGEGGDLPEVLSLEHVVVHADSPVVGSFSCSNELFNRVWTLVRWAQRSNMFSVMTDCPHREKLGWLEEDHLNGPALRYNFDMIPLMGKIVNDMVDAQTEQGMVPSIAPEYVRFGGDNDLNPFRNSPEWGSALILASWQQYVFTGDTALFRRHYGSMKRYMDYLATKAQGHILDFGLGDWLAVGEGTPKDITGTATYFQDAHAMSRIAELLDEQDDAKHYRELAETIRRAFHRKFFDREKGSYVPGSQTANAMPLALGIVEPEHRDSVLNAIIGDIVDRGNALTSGDVGYRYLLRALADNGRSDIVFGMNNHSEHPGYGMNLAKGATALTESWDANPNLSHNHFMLGQINEWFFHDLLGIRPDETQPGFRNMIVRPAVVGDLQWAKARYETVRGEVAVSWRREGKTLHLRVAVPPNMRATIHVPSRKDATVFEGDRAVDTSPNVEEVRGFQDGACVFVVGSGEHVFRSEL